MEGTSCPDGGDPYANEIAVGWATNLTQIQVHSGSTLYLANAAVSGHSFDFATESAGSDIDVEAGGTLVLGTDRSGRITGTVFVDAAATGIACEGGKAGDIGCSLSDAPSSGLPSLIIGQYSGPVAVGIAAGDNTTLSLTSQPRIGEQESWTLDAGPQFLSCGRLGSDLTVTQGVVLQGNASMTFENGAVQCVGEQGFLLQASSQGAPSLSLSNATIQNAGLGIQASAGTVTVSNSTLQYNGGAVEQDSDGTNVAAIDLSGGAAGGTNTIACSNRIQAPGATGVSVLNTTSKALNASNVAWDTVGPDLFACNAQLASCICESAVCESPPGGDAMDAVTESMGAVTTTGNRLTKLDCTAGLAVALKHCDLTTKNCPLSWLTCCPLPDGGGQCDVVCPGS